MLLCDFLQTFELDGLRRCYQRDVHEATEQRSDGLHRRFRRQDGDHPHPQRPGDRVDQRRFERTSESLSLDFGRCERLTLHYRPGW